MSLFNLGNKYADIMEQLELAYAWEPEYVAGKPVDDDGNIIADVGGASRGNDSRSSRTAERSRR